MSVAEASRKTASTLEHIRRHHSAVLRLIDLRRSEGIREIGAEELANFPAEAAFLRISLARLVTALDRQFQIRVRTALIGHPNQVVISMKSSLHPLKQRPLACIADDYPAACLDIAVGIDVDLPHLVSIKF